MALVTHAMIPETLHKGGSGIVLPAVRGLLFALYLALLESVPMLAAKPSALKRSQQGALLWTSSSLGCLNQPTSGE